MQVPIHVNASESEATDWWSRVSDAFERAVETPPADRPRALDALDPNLRQEVASLLEAHDNVHDRFAAPLVSLGVEPGAVPATPLGTDELVGPYRVLREVGRGGMGSVYEAFRADDDFRKRVALKTVAPGRAHPGIVPRFRRERRILARLEHRNIAALYDGGVTSTGVPWFAMEFVEGEPIDEYCRSHNLPLRARLQLLRQACGAVHVAHQNLVVHRDLKPGNILVTADGTVKLLDFGIAKLLAAEENSEDNQQDLTGVDAGPFTLAFASPEQLRNDAVTTASDVYALGVVLFGAVTGRHPFRDADTSQSELRRRIETMAPPASGFGPDLDAVIASAMHKDPARRYASAEQLAEDLRRLDAGLPVHARADSLQYRVQKFARRNPVAVAASTLAVLALITAVVVSTRSAGVAAAERDRARTEAAKATRVTLFVQDMLRSADPTSANPNVKVVDALAAAAVRADSALAGEPEVLASVQSAIGLSYMGLGRYDDAEALFRNALALRRARGPVAAAETAASVRHLATVRARRGHNVPAESLFREALAASRSVTPPDSAGIAETLYALSDVVQYRGDLKAAEALLNEALAIQTSLSGATSEPVAATLNSIAIVQGQQGHWAQAESLSRQALSIMRTRRGADHPDVASLLNSLAFAVQSQGRSQAAESLYREAMRIRERSLGPDHPETAWTYMNLGWMLHDTGHFPEAIVEASKVLALRAKLGDDHPTIGSTLILYGQSQLAVGRVREGEASIRDALRIRERTLPAGHWLIAASRSALGEAVALGGRYAEAEGLLVPALAAIDSARGVNSELSVLARRRLTSLYTRWGKPALASRYRTSAPR